jgi:hypothetical protein
MCHKHYLQVQYSLKNGFLALVHRFICMKAKKWSKMAFLLQGRAFLIGLVRSGSVGCVTVWYGKLRYGY